MEHLLNSSSFVDQLWNKIGHMFGFLDWDQHSIKESIEIWRTRLFSSLVLYYAWGVAPGFLLQAISKEQNRWIFKAQQGTQEGVWKGIIQNIIETILVDKWHPDDWKIAPHEARILHLLDLSPQMIAPSLWKPIVPLVSLPLVILSHWLVSWSWTLMGHPKAIQGRQGLVVFSETPKIRPNLFT